MTDFEIDYQQKQDNIRNLFNQSKEKTVTGSVGGNYSDRRNNPYWISPSGIIFDIKTNDGSREFEVNTMNIKNLGEGEELDVYGADNERLPLSCLFYGDNHDLNANEFFEALKETGKSYLQLHYGKLRQVIVARARLKYSVAEKINTSSVQVLFVEDKGIVDKFVPIDFSKRIKQGNEAIAKSFSEKVKAVTEGEKNSLISTFHANSSKVFNTLKGLTNGVRDKVNQFTSTYNSIENNVMSVVNEPLLLANQVLRLKSIPASIMGSFNETKNAYLVMFQNSLPDFFSQDMLFTRERRNYAHTTTLFSSSAIVGMAEAYANIDYLSKSEVLDAVDLIVLNFDIYKQYLDQMQRAFEGVGTLKGQYLVDTDLLSGVTQAVNAVAGNLIQLSQTLKREFIFELTKETTIINIAEQYYADRLRDNSEEILDFIIKTNKLKDDEILILPRGKEIKVYL